MGHHRVSQVRAGRIGENRRALYNVYRSFAIIVNPITRIFKLVQNALATRYIGWEGLKTTRNMPHKPRVGGRWAVSNNRFLFKLPPSQLNHFPLSAECIAHGARFALYVALRRP